MPMWILVHGILLVIWSSIWLSVYYFRLWTLSAPFNKVTSLRIIFLHLIPLSWLLSSFFVGLLLFIIDTLEQADIVLSVFVPLGILLIYYIYFWFNNSTKQQREEYIQNNIKNFKDNCQNWIKQFPFINEDKYDLQVFISKDKPVGRMIVYELTHKEENELREQKAELPSGVTLLFLKKSSN